VKARGTTTIVGAACEPEVIDLARFLNRMGAHVSGAGSPRITIEGSNELHPAEYTIIPDRIEAGTYLIATAISGGAIILRNVRADHLDAVIETLREIGLKITKEEGSITARSGGPLSPVDITTLPYPVSRPISRLR